MYTYKGQVQVMPLAMVDDLLGIAECGDKSLDLNTTINSRIEMKKPPTIMENQNATPCILESVSMNVLH